MSAEEPTRERVEAYEKVLRCVRYDSTANGLSLTGPICRAGHGTWTDLGCSVAVAAARVEAARVAEVSR